MGKLGKVAAAALAVVLMAALMPTVAFAAQNGKTNEEPQAESAGMIALTASKTWAYAYYYQESATLVLSSSAKAPFGCADKMFEVAGGRQSAGMTSADGFLERLLLRAAVDPSSIKTIEIRNKIKVPADGCDSLFRNLCVTKIVGLGKLDTSRAISLSRMFSDCSELAELDVSGLETAKAKDLSRMFSNCSSLKKIKGLETLDTEGATDFAGLFMGCSTLTSLDVSRLATSKAKDFSNAFFGCSSLKKIKGLSKLDTRNAKRLDGLFMGCASLTSLDVSKLKTAKAKSLAFMFSDCSSLAEIKGLGKLDTRSATSLQSMFEGCSKLRSLDVAKFKTAKVKDFSDLFSGCVSLKKICGLSTWSTKSAVVMRGMFQNCRKLVSLDLKSFNTAKVRDSDYLFEGCKSLESIKVGKGFRLKRGEEGDILPGKTWRTSSGKVFSASNPPFGKATTYTRIK